MSDTSPAIEPTLSPEDAAEIEQVVKEVKRGFSLKDRLEKRGLRKVTVTLFLDENVGAEHKEVADKAKFLGEQIDEMSKMLLGAEEEFTRKALEQEIETLTAERDALIPQRDALEERLRDDALVVHLRAVPPVMVKNAHRLARQALEIAEKNVPKDRMDEYLPVINAQLLAFTVQSITETATGQTNDGLTYEDARDLMDYLPTEQSERLASALNEVQFRDQFSKSIEAQEDFS